MAPLLVVTGPPGAGKSSVARVIADSFVRSALVEGDAFFGFLAAGAVEPWLPASSEHNTIVTRAACAAGQYAIGGFETFYDGVVGPWFLATFGAATGLARLDYVILLPPVERCVQRVAARAGHGFTDETATRKMHAEFALASVAERHVLHDPPDDLHEIVQLVQAARRRHRLTHSIA
jgi:predicted ABC-type ATPase